MRAWFWSVILVAAGLAGLAVLSTASAERQVWIDQMKAWLDRLELGIELAPAPSPAGGPSVQPFVQNEVLDSVAGRLERVRDRLAERTTGSDKRNGDKGLSATMLATLATLESVPLAAPEATYDLAIAGAWAREAEAVRAQPGGMPAGRRLEPGEPLVRLAAARNGAWSLVLAFDPRPQGGSPVGFVRTSVLAWKPLNPRGSTSGRLAAPLASGDRWRLERQLEQATAALEEAVEHDLQRRQAMAELVDVVDEHRSDLAALAADVLAGRRPVGVAAQENSSTEPGQQETKAGEPALSIAAVDGPDRPSSPGAAVPEAEGVAGTNAAEGAPAPSDNGASVEAVPEARIWRSGRRFRDCPHCPAMMPVPAGKYVMGSPVFELGRQDAEGPLTLIEFERPFAIGVFEVTVQEYRRFVDATAHAGGNCDRRELAPERQLPADWQAPGFRQGSEHPVTCVIWADAAAYAAWLAVETGAPYRLPTEAEWEYAARAGSSAGAHWTPGEPAQCAHANGADMVSTWPERVNCDDGFMWTAPVGQFISNRYGLHDFLGNVAEWTHDCWTPSHVRPAVGPRDGGECSERTVRGGHWHSGPMDLRFAARRGVAGDIRRNVIGFRVARDPDQEEAWHVED